MFAKMHHPDCVQGGNSPRTLETPFVVLSVVKHPFISSSYTSLGMTVFLYSRKTGKQFFRNKLLDKPVVLPRLSLRA